MNTVPMVSCLNCKNEFRGYHKTKLFCSIRCRWAFNARKRVTLRGEKKEKIPSLETLRIEDRNRLEILHVYQIGDVITFNDMIGRIIHRIERGVSVNHGWSEVQELYSDVEPVALWQFDSKRPTTTHRYFIEVHRRGKKIAYCPKLGSIDGPCYDSALDDHG